MSYLRLALTLLALASSPAFASEPLPKVTVAYADLDLRSDEGRKALDRRLEQAAGDICLDSPAVKDIARQQSTRKCVATLLAQLAPLREHAIGRSAGSAPALAGVEPTP